MAWIGISDYAQEHLGNVVYVELHIMYNQYNQGRYETVLNNVVACAVDRKSVV